MGGSAAIVGSRFTSAARRADRGKAQEASSVGRCRAPRDGSHRSKALASLDRYAATSCSLST